jgi:hypothetical protein
MLKLVAPFCGLERFLHPLKRSIDNGSRTVAVCHSFPKEWSADTFKSQMDPLNTHIQRVVPLNAAGGLAQGKFAVVFGDQKACQDFI